MSNEVDALMIDVAMELQKRDGDVLRYDQKIKDVGLCPVCSAKVADMANSGEHMTLGSIVVNLLDSVSTTKDGLPLDGMEKRRRGLLADKIYGSDGPTELSVDDLSLLKQLVGDNCAPIVVKQLFPILDPSLKE